MFNWICDTTDCWAATGSMLSGWAAWAGVIGVVWIANRGLSTYRRQKQEDRRIEAADDILTFAYKFKRAMQAARSPGILEHETVAAQKTLEESWVGWAGKAPEEQQRIRIAQVMYMRLRENNPTWGQIFEIMPRARALFGEEAEAQLQAFWSAYVMVEVACDSYAEDPGNDPEYSKGIRAEMWGRSKDDPVASAIDKAVAKLEGMLLPVIRADHKPVKNKLPDASKG